MTATLLAAIDADPRGVVDWVAQHNLIGFARRMFSGYRAAAHHWAIARALEAVERGDIDRLVITMPPRHGKSELASVHFPAWFLGRNPDKRIIAASYAAALAYRFSRRARNLMSDPRWPFPITTAGDLANVQNWDIANHRGGYFAAGVGGGITGHGADLLLVDDPVASAEEADSATYRDRAWEWFNHDAVTRLEPGGRIVLIGTRWHEDDLIGRALASGERWEHIDLPALTDDGVALWPERFGVAALERIRAQIGSRAFAALYQQRPAPSEGAILKREWWQYWREPLPQFDWLLQSWDTAFKKGEENDYSVGLTVGLAGGRVYLLDLWRGKVEFPNLKRTVRAQAMKWQPDEILVEDKASGQSLIQELGPERNPDDPFPEPPLPIIGISPDRDKTARAHAISPYAEGGRLFLPVGAEWVDPFVHECATFPNGAHDDQVDALTMAVLRLKDRLGLLRPIDPAILTYFDRMPR